MVLTTSTLTAQQQLADQAVARVIQRAEAALNGFAHKAPVHIANGNIKLVVEPGALTITNLQAWGEVTIDKGDFESLAIALVKLGVLAGFEMAR